MKTPQEVKNDELKILDYERKEILRKIYKAECMITTMQETIETLSLKLELKDRMIKSLREEN